MASHRVGVLTACLCSYHLVSLFLFLLLSCSLECPYIILLLLMVMHMPVISLSLFVSWLCVDRQSVMNSCGLALYSILMLCWCFCIVFLEACVIGLLLLSWILLPVVWGLQSSLLHGWNSSDIIFLGHGVCLELSFYVAVVCFQTW